MSNLKIELEPRRVASCPNPDVPEEIRNAFPNGMLQHQVEVYQQAEEHDIILDLAPTGTGKTSAGLSVIAHNRDRHAIYIAPTNALIEQQTEAAKNFVQDANSPHVVIAASARQVSAWPNDRVGKRPGEKIYNLLREPTTIFSECENRPLLLVTNPDIFYYAAFFQYGRLDRSNIASVFYSSFATIIFDEFHLYDAKQLVSLLFYLALSKVFGYFQYNRKVVLLTATPEPSCEAALERLAAEGVKIARVEGEAETTQMLPSQTAVSLEIRKYLEKQLLIKEIAQEVTQHLQQFPEHYGAVILDSKDTLNRLSDQLRAQGLENLCGRITGNTPTSDRQIAAQKQVILATSTVDVGFNFERENSPQRQNLDWLIFSCRDRFSFWQRLGRVGRVLGKPQTNIPSEAIAYLPEKAWEEGIGSIDCSSGRDALKQNLESLKCMERPFLEIYWRSEAFLEIARPLLELESSLENLPEYSLISELYQTLQSVLGGKRDWIFYRKRMQILKGAENISQKIVKDIQKEWKFIKGGQSCVISFMRAIFPEDWEEFQCGSLTLEKMEEFIKQDFELAKDLKQYSVILKESYAPLFRFRDSLFTSLNVTDAHCLLLDDSGDTNLDPIHLLRFYEFESDGEHIEVISRADTPYTLVFSLQVEDLEEFKNLYLGKLYAFENCTIKRMRGDVIRPTPPVIEKKLVPGIVVAESSKNRWALVKLKKQGLESYRITVSDPFNSKEYLFFPSLSGILAIAAAGIALKCPDEEDFWIA